MVLISLLGTVAAQGDAVLIDRIVAVVEEDVIMVTELEKRLHVIRDRFRQSKDTAPPVDLLKKQLLEHLIVERLQLQMAERRGIRIDDLTLNEAMRKIASRNDLGLEGFREKLLDKGIDYIGFREQVRRELVIDALRARVVDRKVQVTDQEVADLISSQTGVAGSDLEYQLHHILVTLPEAASAEQINEARTKAEAIRARILDGEDFRQLAMSESDGQKALEGGDLGWRKASQLPTIFVRHVSDMMVGEISELIRSPSGFHIIQLSDRKGEQKRMIKQTRTRHILISTSALIDDDQARQKLSELKRRIENGDDFAELAQANSADTNSALKGGDLGWTSPGILVPEYEKVMNGLEIGRISEPFRSSFGWHILQVMERRSHDSTQEVLRSQARTIIRKRKVEEETELWLRRLRNQSYVEYRLQIEEQG
ncbi:MAG: molecular chaperone SurA [Gammaproteobacteria bacterium]|nr:molecular chaperone SurA [Gammaproteobacteria bacterium]